MKSLNGFRIKRKAAVCCCILLCCIVHVFLSWDVNKVDSKNGFVGMTRKLSSQENRPTIYTFYEPIFPEEERRTGMTHKHDMQMLVAWREAWESAGWRTKVLSTNDATMHPHFEDLITKLQTSMELKNQGQSEILCFIRWLAMTAVGGGWMSDFDVFPLTLKGEKGRELPNDGKFTTFDGLVPSLLSGSAMEWDRMAHQVIAAVDLMSDHITDMNALKFISEERPEVDFVQQRKVLREVGYISLNKVDCDLAEDMVAVHFSFFRMTQAWELGFLPHVQDYHNAPGERPVFGKQFIRNWAKQCGSGDKFIPIIETPKAPIITEQAPPPPPPQAESNLPTIYTFYMAEGPDRKLLKAQNDALIEVWDKIWTEYGWQTKVLTVEDARFHPDFQKLEDQLQKISSIEDRVTFYRFIAMANLPKGGWYADYDTFPLFMGLNDVNFPNKGKFTLYDGYNPSLMSANHQEWNRLTNALFASVNVSSSSEEITIISALQNLWKNDVASEFFTNNQVFRVGREFQDSKNIRCGQYRKRRAIHFKFAYLQADVLYAAPELFRNWHETCFKPIKMQKQKEREKAKQNQIAIPQQQKQKAYTQHYQQANMQQSQAGFIEQNQQENMQQSQASIIEQNQQGNMQHSQAGIMKQNQQENMQHSQAGIMEQNQQENMQHSQAGFANIMEQNQQENMQHSQAGIKEQNQHGNMQQSQAGIMEQNQQGNMQHSQANVMEQNQQENMQHSQADIMKQNQQENMQHSQAGIMKQNQQGNMQHSQAGFANIMEQNQQENMQHSQAGIKEQNQQGNMQHSKTGFANIMEQNQQENTQQSQAGIKEQNQQENIQQSQAGIKEQNQQWNGQNSPYQDAVNSITNNLPAEVAVKLIPNNPTAQVAVKLNPNNPPTQDALESYPNNPQTQVDMTTSANYPHDVNILQ